MTKITKILTIIAFLFVILIKPVYANTVNDYWTQEKLVDKIDTQGYKYIELDEEIYQYSKEDLSDLRVLNNKGDYIPYFIESNQESNDSISSNYQSDLISTFQKLDSSFFDFKIIKDDNIDSTINSMKLNIDYNVNYAKTVEIYGSYDNVKWDFITHKGIYNVSNNSDTSILFNSLLKYEYYRIVILDNIEDIELSSINLIKSENRYESHQFTKSTTLDYKVAENKSNKTTEITIDNKSNLKITDLLLDIEGEFYRKYEIYDDYGKTNLEGFIKNDYSDINMETYRNSKTIKIVIHNNDDKPLVIDNIKEEYLIDQIIFFADNNEQYSIQFGNPLAEKPMYDLINKKDDIQVMEQVGFGIANKLEIPTEELIDELNYKLILNMTVLIVSVLLMFVLARAMKKE